MDRYHQNEMHWRVTERDFWLLPRRLLWSLALMMLFLAEYYAQSCRQTEDGSWVSVDMFLPVTPHLNPLCFVQNFFVHCSNKVEDAFWTMPYK